MILVRAAVTINTWNELSMFVISSGVSSTEFGDLETLCKAVVKEKQPFERLEVSKETLLKMFKVRGSEHSHLLSADLLSCGHVFVVLQLFKIGIM